MNQGEIIKALFESSSGHELILDLFEKSHPGKDESLTSVIKSLDGSIINNNVKIDTTYYKFEETLNALKGDFLLDGFELGFDVASTIFGQDKPFGAF